MSIQAVAWVLDHSRSRGFARLVLISLANHHNAGTGQCNPGQRRIADEAGISPGSVSAQIAKLVTLGEVVVEDPGGSHRSAQYRLTFAQEVSEVVGTSTRGSDDEYARENESTRGDGASTRGPEPRGIKNLEPRDKPRGELTLSPASGDDAHETGKVSARSETARASRSRRAGTKPRRSDARADGLVREWWEAQDPKPTQPWPAAVGVVSSALRGGWTEDEVRRALWETGPPLSGGRLDYVRSRWVGRRPANMAPVRDDASHPSGPMSVPSEWEEQA